MDQQPNPNVQPEQQPAAQPNKPMNKTWQIVAIVVAGILVVGGISYGSYYFWQNSSEKVSQNASNSPLVSVSPSPSVSASPSATPDETADWQTYKNEQYGFQLKIPNDWSQFKVRERKLDDGIVFIEFGFLTSLKTWTPSELPYAYLWGISVLTKEQYENFSDPRCGLPSPPNCKPSIFRQNEDYIFLGPTRGQDYPEDLEKQMQGMQQVFSTFKFIS